MRALKNKHQRIVVLILMGMLMLACDLLSSAVMDVQDLQPLSTPTPDPAAGEMLPSGLTAAEDANSGTHTYIVGDAQTRNGFGGINMADAPVITQEFSGGSVVATSDGGDPVEFTRIGVNTYQGPSLNRSYCADVSFIRIYIREGFVNYFQCQVDDSIQALITYALAD